VSRPASAALRTADTAQPTAPGRRARRGRRGDHPLPVGVGEARCADGSAIFITVTSSWQVLRAIVYAQRPLTVPQIARRMGLTRQSVHTTVSRLLADGVVELVPNEDHQRSQLVRLTAPGQARYQAIDHKQATWVNRLTAGLTHSDLDIAARVLAEL
jgi:DNA-binding MarR family transcriptional regulator